MLPWHRQVVQRTSEREQRVALQNSQCMKSLINEPEYKDASYFQNQSPREQKKMREKKQSKSFEKAYMANVLNTISQNLSVRECCYTKEVINTQHNQMLTSCERSNDIIMQKNHRLSYSRSRLYLRFYQSPALTVTATCTR